MKKPIIVPSIALNEFYKNKQRLFNHIRSLSSDLLKESNRGNTGKINLFFSIKKYRKIDYYIDKLEIVEIDLHNYKISRQSKIDLESMKHK